MGETGEHNGGVILRRNDGPTFGSVVATKRQGRGLSQAELARLSGCSASHLSNVEKDRSAPPNEDFAVRLAMGLGLQNPEFREFIRQAAAALTEWRQRERQMRQALRERGENLAAVRKVAKASPQERLVILAALANAQQDRLRGHRSTVGTHRSERRDMNLVGWAGYRLDDKGRFRLRLDLPEVPDAELVVDFADGDLTMRVERRATLTSRSPPM